MRKTRTHALPPQRRHDVPQSFTQQNIAPMASKEQILQPIKQRYNIVGNCDALNRALELAVRVARVDLSVLVLGENGSGKEIMPRIIHDASSRKGHKYLALNCGAIPEGTIDSELFGHTEGAFTGSVGKREGYFAAADGGTLFLDEVGELPLQTQVRLLRVLETGEYIPVGANEPRKTNVRIVAATNVDMKRAIREGKFREDLFYRLSAVTINIPPLRERGTDIDMLFRKFALENQERYKMPPIRLNEEARAMLMRYPWPGNVRQLKNIVDSMSILCDEREITPETLSLYIPADENHTQLASVSSNNMPAWGGTALEANDMAKLLVTIKQLADDVKKLKHDVAELKQHQSSAPVQGEHDSSYGTIMIEHRGLHATTPAIQEDDFYEEIPEDNDAASAATQESRPMTIQEMEEAQIRESLERNGGNRRKTAKELNLSERTLYRKINDYGLNRKH